MKNIKNLKGTESRCLQQEEILRRLNKRPKKQVHAPVTMDVEYTDQNQQGVTETMTGLKRGGEGENIKKVEKFLTRDKQSPLKKDRKITSGREKRTPKWLRKTAKWARFSKPMPTFSDSDSSGD